MFRTLSAQTCSSVLVFSSFALAELAARLLHVFPASNLAWYTNLVVFAPFERCRAIPSPFGSLVGPDTLVQSLVLVGLAIAAQAVRLRLGVAVITHLSLASSVVLARAWMTDDVLGRVSFTVLSARESAGSCLVVVTLALSSIGCVLCHISFVQAIRWSSNVSIRATEMPLEKRTNIRPYPRFTYAHRAWIV